MMRIRGPHLNHVQAQVLQIAQPGRLLLLDLLKDEILHPIARIRDEHSL